MPYITLEGGPLAAAQKEQLIQQLTQVSAEIMKIPPEFFLVTIKELPDENIGIGGKPINKVKAAYAKKHTAP